MADIETPDDVTKLVERAKWAANAVYLAAEEGPAIDISRIIRGLLAALAMANARADLEATARHEAEQERDEARKVVTNTLWMAGRYADGRKTYAVGLYNDMREIAQCRGGYEGGAMSALDGMAPEWPTQGERLATAVSDVAALRADLVAAAGHPRREGDAVRGDVLLLGVAALGGAVVVYAFAAALCWAFWLAIKKGRR